MWCTAISAALISVAIMEQPDLLWSVVADGKAVVRADSTETPRPTVQHERIDRLGEPVFLGYPHGPKTAEYVPKGRRAAGEACSIEAQVSTNVVFEVTASIDSFPCETGDSPVMRAALSAEASPLDRAIYDRASDRLFRVDQAESVRFERTAFGWRV